MLVVKVGNLKEFMEEVRPFGDMRFSQHEVRTYHSMGGTVKLCLDLMGFNEMGELIWLHHGIQLQLSPASREPWTEQSKAIDKAFPGLVNLVREYLAQHYIVRPGVYGIAQDIAPLDGELEITRWDKETQTFVLVQTESLAEIRLQEAQG